MGPLRACDDEGKELYRAAVSTELSSWPCFRARLLLNYGRWLRRRRRVAQSRRPISAARDSLDALAFDGLAEIAWPRTLRAWDESSIRRTPDARDYLTPQELQSPRWPPRECPTARSGRHSASLIVRLPTASTASSQSSGSRHAARCATPSPTDRHLSRDRSIRHRTRKAPRSCCWRVAYPHSRAIGQQHQPPSVSSGNNECLQPSNRRSGEAEPAAATSLRSQRDPLRVGAVPGISRLEAGAP